MIKIADCHPNRKHYARGLCGPCYWTKYRLDNKEKYTQYKTQYYKNHKEEIIQKNAQYYQDHKEEIAQYRAQYEHDRYKNDLQYRIAAILRSRVRAAIKNGQKAGSFVRDLGCSIPQFILFIENQFEPGMAWDNQGEWHLDHVIPLSSFDLEDRTQFLEAANWLNYQPLWATDNFKKGARMIYGK